MVKPWRNSTRNVCAYCGASGNLTKDHVPPKNLFLTPRPSNLISVPACKVCHENTSKDDEYFRLKISMRDDVSLNPEARAAWNTVFHSLARNKLPALGCRFYQILDTLI